MEITKMPSSPPTVLLFPNFLHPKTLVTSSSFLSPFWKANPTQVFMYTRESDIWMKIAEMVAKVYGTKTEASLSSIFKIFIHWQFILYF